MGQNLSITPSFEFPVIFMYRKFYFSLGFQLLKV